VGYVVGLAEIGQTQVAEVGGKAANLGELGRIDGVRVPPGFCVTADAFRRIVAGAPSLDGVLDRLVGLRPGDREAVGTVSAEIRRVIGDVPLPDDLVAAVGAALARLGEHAAYAVRSSATAEDLPTASFAGQQDSYLNVVGVAAILEQVRRCWASLFTERAVAYRLRNGFDHRRVQMAVVVQAMVNPAAAGILFTADPVTSNRRVATVDAVWGLGEALVSGVANGDVYTVRDDGIVAKTVGVKQRAVRALPDGGTGERTVEPERQRQPVLTDAQIGRLVRLGRRIEAHFGRPQDIEWCLVGEDFHIVQSRPITTLFPVPPADDGKNHVYVSVGHQQMMTDAMKPLGLSVWQLTTPRPMAEAGGRLFVDVAPALATPTSRANILDALGRHDPLIGDALQTVLDRGDFLPSLPDEDPAGARAGAEQAPIEPDPALVAELIEQSRSSLAAVRRDIRTRSGPELFDFIRQDIGELRRVLFNPRSLQLIMAGMEAAWWLNDRIQEWLGEKNVADALTQSVPHNVTSEMGLALLDVADVMRPHPDVLAFLQQVEHAQVEQPERGDDGFLDELATIAGGPAARDAFRAFLDEYGMRCPGEIDITRPRWSERPAALVSTILGNIRNHEPGAAARRFEHGRQQARTKDEELLRRLRALPDGQRKADETKRMIDRVRTFTGYREYPKYGMISRYFVYKQALLREAERLAAAHVVREIDDVLYLRFDEFHEVVRTNRVDDRLVRGRREEFRSFQQLTPPRVFTSDGEVITGAYRRDDLPPGALAGLAVSAGTVEGRARVIVDMAQADLEAGDILVTAYTDPSWTPLFVGIAGLVTEVGGLMTHGAVIAREYGLPAVVGVQEATRLIQDRQRIRVHGTEGYVEILPAPGAAS
jgi:phosphoenolpyruvate synthase/pyruvate phosphate dikinase